MRSRPSGPQGRLSVAMGASPWTAAAHAPFLSSFFQAPDGAQEGSPRREPWVNNARRPLFVFSLSPGRGERIAARGDSYAPGGADKRKKETASARPRSHGLRRGLPSVAPSGADVNGTGRSCRLLLHPVV